MSEVRKSVMGKMLSSGGKTKMKDVSSRVGNDELEKENKRKGKLKNMKSAKLFQSKKGSKASKSKDKSMAELTPSKTKDKLKVEFTESETGTKSPTRKSPMKRIRHKLRKSLSKKKFVSVRSVKSNEALNTSVDETMSNTTSSSNLSVASKQLKLSPHLEPVAEKSLPNTSDSGISSLETSSYGISITHESTLTHPVSISPPADATLSLTAKSENDNADEPTLTQTRSQQTQSTTDLPPLSTEVSNTLVEASNDEKKVQSEPIASTSINVSTNDEVNSTANSVRSALVIDQMEILDAVLPQSTKGDTQDSLASSVYVTKDGQNSVTGKDDQDSQASSVFIAKDDVKSTTSGKGSDIDPAQVEKTSSRLSDRVCINDLQSDDKDDTNSAANDQVSLQETVPPLASKCEDDEDDEFLKYYSNLDEECGAVKHTFFRYLISCCFNGIEGHKKGLITAIEGHKKGLITNEDNLEDEIPEIPEDNLENSITGNNKLES